MTCPARFHTFTRLVLVVAESALEGVRTEHRFELRATRTGAEVWRSSELHAPGGTCSSGDRYLGALTSRQVIELLERIERTGIYEALPAMGIVSGGADGETAASVVSMRLESDRETRPVLAKVSAERELGRSLVEAVREAVEAAQERALTASG